MTEQIITEEPAVSRWDRFLIWFADSPIGTAIRVGVGAASVWILDNIGAFELSPTVAAGVVALVSMLLRWANPKDDSYGRRG